jgi:hypothetical protein
MNIAYFERKVRRKVLMKGDNGFPGKEEGGIQR